MKNNNFFNKKGLKSYRSSLGTALQMLRQPINHPGRYKPFQYFDYHYGPATPPSKGGEIFYNLPNYNNTLRLTAFGVGDEAQKLKRT